MVTLDRHAHTSVRPWGTATTNTTTDDTRLLHHRHGGIRQIGAPVSTPHNFSNFTVTSISGEPMPLSTLAGGVTLVVNVASQCGLTPQYAGLEELYRRYHAQGLTVLGCPCNQFGGQEPGTEDTIVQFCSTTFDVTFPLTAKLNVNGDDADALWQWMKQEKRGLLGTTSIKWNFTKFLIGRDGQVIERFDPTTVPSDMIPAIERALGTTSVP